MNHPVHSHRLRKVWRHGSVSCLHPTLLRFHKCVCFEEGGAAAQEGRKHALDYLSIPRCKACSSYTTLTFKGLPRNRRCISNLATVSLLCVSGLKSHFLSEGLSDLVVPLNAHFGLKCNNRCLSLLCDETGFGHLASLSMVTQVHQVRIHIYYETSS